MTERELMEVAVEAVELAESLGVEYADCRAVARRSEEVSVKNEAPEGIRRSEEAGLGVRVLVDGAWGFSASGLVRVEEARRVVERALEIAKASAKVRRERVGLAPSVVVPGGRYETPLKRDPFLVPLEEKLALLIEATSRMAKEPSVKVRRAVFRAYEERKFFASTEGSRIYQRIVHCGGGIEATAVDEGDTQTRSYPASHGGNYAASGWEFFESLRLPEEAERVASEAVALLKADPCPEGETTLILGPAQLALQIHESCGHPSELDRVLGTETSFAGTSFLTLDKLGRFKYGSEEVNIVADATLDLGLGTFGFDDEGVPASRFYLVREGTFCGYLSDRESARKAGLEGSTGCARADGWQRIPLVRMTNISLEPGEAGTLEDLISDTRKGILMETNRSWSIDDLRLNFQFGCEIAWEIRRGRRARLLKNPVYMGITPEFWRSCDAVCGPSEWRLFGLLNCGKGEPLQLMHVGHGASPARFRKVKVGAGR
ncbi:MAG TPA: TldD/PmbA family protein [Armatimonadetes bacterium]|nr:TldD/PmbA family protein [Armatimonadota bacterium]